MQRVITYVDGFNLYFGLKSKGWRRYYWLNIHQLAQNLLKPNQELVQTKYFTSRVASPPTKVKRQSTYIEALQTTEDLDVYYGKYQLNDIVCQKCGFVDKIPVLHNFKSKRSELPDFFHLGPPLRQALAPEQDRGPKSKG